MAALAGTMVPVLFFFGSYFLSSLSAEEDAESTYLGHPDLVVGVGVILGGLLSGVLQPPTRHPALNALLYSPGIWIALWFSQSACVQGELLAPADRNLLLTAVYPVLLGWFSCWLGLSVRRRHGHGHRHHHRHRSHGNIGAIPDSPPIAPRGQTATGPDTAGDADH
jgi:hypothetical protein